MTKEELREEFYEKYGYESINNLWRWFLSNSHRLQPKAEEVSDEEIEQIVQEKTLSTGQAILFKEGFKEAMSRLQPKSDAIEFLEWIYYKCWSNTGGSEFLRWVNYHTGKSVDSPELYQLFLDEQAGKEGNKK